MSGHHMQRLIKFEINPSTVSQQALSNERQRVHAYGQKLKNERQNISSVELTLRFFDMIAIYYIA